MINFGAKNNISRMVASFKVQTIRSPPVPDNIDILNDTNKTLCVDGQLNLKI